MTSLNSPAQPAQVGKPKRRKRTRGPHTHLWARYQPLSALPDELSAFDENDVVCVVCDLLHRHQ